MRPAVVIAQASLAEHKRRRLVLFFFVLSVLLTAPIVYLVRSRQFDELSRISAAPRGLVAFASVSALQLLALVATLAVSMGNIGRPFASGEALTILARPVARWQFALGRLLASAAAVVVFCLVLGVETAVVQLVAGGHEMGLLWAHWATFAFNMVVLVAIGTVISAIASNPVLVAVTTFFTYESVRAIGSVHALVTSGQVGGSVAQWFNVAWVVTPKFLSPPGTSGPLQTTPGLVLWAAAWLVALAGVATWLTSRKEV